MSDQSIPARDDRSEKRNRLKEIVSRLGPDATAPQIREECYRVGFGAVNSHMLIVVRNELWPDREKHGGGRPVGSPATTAGALPCLHCGSSRTYVYGRPYTRKTDGLTRRTVKCHNCAQSSCHLADSSRLFPKSITLDATAEATEKQCSWCKRVLPVDCFGKRSIHVDELERSRAKSPYRSHCKDCSNEKRAATQINQLLGRFGISLGEYEAMLARQNGCCAICGRSDPGINNKGQKARRVMCLDHCHATGKARGLLCNRCNLGIGNFDDDVSRLEAAITYLREAQATPQDSRKEVPCGWSRGD